MWQMIYYDGNCHVEVKFNKNLRYKMKNCQMFSANCI